MGIGIVIPTYNRADHLELLLESIAEQTTEPSEVVVADDGSTDRTAVVVADFAARSTTPVRHLSLGRNEGMRAGRARNIGASNLGARSLTVLFLDPDLVLAPDAVQRCAEAVDRHPGSVVMGTVAWMRDEDSERIRAAVRAGDTDALDALVPDDAPGRVEGTFVGPELRAGFDDAAGIVHPVRADWSVSLNYAWPREAYLALGGFNERMHGYGFDDMEIGLRAAAAGMTAVADPTVRAWHKWHPKGPTAMLENQVNLDFVLRRWAVSDVIAANTDWSSPVHYHADRGGSLRIEGDTTWVISRDRQHRLRLPDARWAKVLGFLPAAPLTDPERDGAVDEGTISDAWLPE